jgi:predicted small metal-binding protein
MNSIFAHLWKDHKDLAKRVIFEDAFNKICDAIEPAIKDRIIKRMEDSHGQKDQYPKPYLKL